MHDLIEEAQLHWLSSIFYHGISYSIRTNSNIEKPPSPGVVPKGDYSDDGNDL